MAKQSSENLAKLQEKYPAALYSYFRVKNLRSASEKFFAGDDKSPNFIHNDKLTKAVVRQVQRSLDQDVKSNTGNESALQFLQWRKAEYEILAQFCLLRDKKNITEADRSDYLDAQYKLYGGLDLELFGAILAYLRAKANERGKISQWQKLSDKVNIKPSKTSLPAPDSKVFNYYTKLFCEAFPNLCQVLERIKEKDSYSSAEIKEYFASALQAIGADKAGWRVVLINSGGNIVISKFKKKILLPRSFSPKSALRLRQVIVHEVGGHVQRSLNRLEQQYNGYDDNEEGLAILLEQLVDNHFVHKRAMRYLAICLAVGLDGRPRDFREVYDILLRAYKIIGYGNTSAKVAAFGETTRAFRGGLPDEPGVVYIKDKIYLEGNLKVWQQLQAKHLSKNEFRQLFNGRDTMAKES